MVDTTDLASRPGLLSEIRSFGRMIKFAHSIFALPFAAVAVMVAVSAGVVDLTLETVLLLLLCMVTARTAAMGFNRIVDRRIDAMNPRTSGREIPAGTIDLARARLFTFGSVALFVGGAFAINTLCGLLAIPVILLLLGYSLTKRYTWGVHFVLGLCLGAAPLGVWFALTGAFDPGLLALAFGVTLWTAGFDVYYSLQDEVFDREKGLRSIPVRFGQTTSIRIVRLLHLLALVGFASFGYLAGLNVWFWIGFVAVAGILVFEAWILRNGDIERIDLAFFTANGYISILFALGVAGSLWL